MWVVGASSIFLIAMSIWLLLTGRKPPGILGRGLTSGDDQRTHRAPPIYFRAMGTFVASAALVGFFLVWVISVMPQPSPGTLEVLVAWLLLLMLTNGSSLAWMIYLSVRYRLFRWDRP
jgi:hypothetical protein